MSNIITTFNVTPIGQTNSMSCWAAAAAMLFTWKNGIQFTEISVAQMAGQLYVDALNNNTGLPPSQVRDFAQALNLGIEAPQNWTPDGYNQLLSSFGPIWIGTAIFSNSGIYKHVRILSGMIGDGTFDGTTATLVDPAGPNSYQETITQLGTELEEIAREDLDDKSELNPQVIHFL